MAHQNTTESQSNVGNSLRRNRLMLDIKELMENPYPNIAFHISNDDLSVACLVLTPSNYKPLHLTVYFSPMYPLDPPQVKMNSDVHHPNVFNDYICATILRRTDEHTPAYTLKGIAIQLLSFFSSDTIEQDYGGVRKNLSTFRAVDRQLIDSFTCNYCYFGQAQWKSPRKAVSSQPYDARVSNNPDQWPTLHRVWKPRHQQTQSTKYKVEIPPPAKVAVCEIDRLPTELMLLILEQLDFEDLTSFAAAWPRISDIVREFDVIRQRELQCFCLKQTYHSVNLGVGVSIESGHIASEFDLLSQEAYRHWNIRLSVNNLHFDHWLPLPISPGHWGRVKKSVKIALDAMVQKIPNKGTFTEAQVLFTFMTDVVIRLTQVTDSTTSCDSSRTNLRHASEKAIDSYFHLFHLLVCLATEDHTLVVHANRLLQNFISGKRSKVECPSLGHLHIALLISDVEVTEGLIKAIIIEAITRNVVWLFDKIGSNMPELSYLERDPVSAYRLDQTFRGSRTSYRILMFSELFRRTARPSHKKPLSQVRDELFDRHGAPPRGAAQRLAETMRRLHTINDFPSFLREMGIQEIPNARTFTGLLRKAVQSSMEKGYSQRGVPTEYALLLRIEKDPHVSMSDEEARWVESHRHEYAASYLQSFFPNNRNLYNY
ncbi:uncharacterized protein F4812DRAFT_407814 [Daldinia caldariorum]|uniref:uncharacterized protein n=1 Tax=Daldinia caldariorum TaxID=326644 RepID=UPI002007443E|nr:uncharacterized protein F4812DRAFT_407814 [Daldinia caldariorum]KAI1472211.1 hypothetical protein F4812DRAFT_407814 [Daldinia caldariorum]